MYHVPNADKRSTLHAQSTTLSKAQAAGPPSSKKSRRKGRLLNNPEALKYFPGRRALSR
jgi:hypothetical protein